MQINAKYDLRLQVRRLAVSLADELFSRSSAFRAMIAGTFEAVLELSVGFRAGKPLPLPHQEATLLRERALECVERWSEKFGVMYPEASELQIAARAES